MMAHLHPGRRIDRPGDRRAADELEGFMWRLNDFRRTSNPAENVLLNVRLFHLTHKDKEMVG